MNLQRLNYRYPILRNIGRSYRSTDVANIPFRGEARGDLAISGGSTLECTERSRSLQGQLWARQESLPVCTRVIEDRTRPWHKLGSARHSVFLHSVRYLSVPA